MAQKSKKAQLHVTPKGKLQYPWLNSPDTKYKEEGEYHTRLLLPANSFLAAALCEKIDEEIEKVYNEALKEASTPKAKKAVKYCEDKPYKIEEDDDGNETGFISFSFKRLASGIDKETKEPWSRRIPLFDSLLKVLPKDTKIGGGTTARISFEINPFYTAKLGAGVSLRLYSVQILELVEWGEQDGSRFGFSNEETDFPASDLADEEDAEESEDEEEIGDDDF